MFYSDGDRKRQVDILPVYAHGAGMCLEDSGQVGDGVDGIFGNNFEEAVKQFQGAIE